MSLHTGLSKLSLLFTLLIHTLLIFAGVDSVEAHDIHLPQPRHKARVHAQLAARQTSAFNTILQTRLSLVVAGTNASSISNWLTTLGPDGKWPPNEVDYTTGCPAQRASWPAETHWVRITTMSAAWHGVVTGAEAFAGQGDLLQAIGRAMDFWFANDFTNPSCLDSGGTPACPCGTPGFWNTNWFSSVIGTPNLVGQTCLLLGSVLSASQATACTRFSSRSYNCFFHPVNGMGSTLTGANALAVASIGVDFALRTANTTLLADAYSRADQELVIQNAVMADGIRADGSFGQHAGLLYQGGYGKDFVNDVLNMETPAAGTQYAPASASMNAFVTLLDAAKWMTFQNINTSVVEWDYSVLGRFITFPASQNDGLQMNMAALKNLGQKWPMQALVDIVNALSQNTTSVNAGNSIGNRMFYANDYMVHRGAGFVTTLKMFSQRTKNFECTNNQNPFGYHLSDGALYTYIRGDEYRDVFAPWDWTKIPGTTATASSVLSCNPTKFIGIPSFVGGASDGAVGVAAMKYTDPATKFLRWQKTWFFMEDAVQMVMIANITVTPGGDSAVFSVLDQKRHNGPIYVNGAAASVSKTYASPNSLWHGNIGYTFTTSTAFNLSISVGPRTGDWATIGTSGQPPTTLDMFGAWLNHRTLSTPVSYMVFLGMDVKTFSAKSQSTGVQIVRNDAHVSAIYDQKHNTIMVVFWDLAGGSATFTPQGTAQVTISSNANIAIIYRIATGKVIVADPSQKLATVQIVLKLAASGAIPPGWTGRTMNKSVGLPQGGTAGNSVVWTL